MNKQKLTYEEWQIYEHDTPHDIPDEARREVARQIAKYGFAVVGYKPTDSMLADRKEYNKPANS